MQDGFVVRHAALVYSQLLVHFEEFVLHLLQTTGHIVRALTLQFQGILTLAELLQGLLGALQLHLQVRQGILVSADSGGQLFLLRHVLLQFCETLVESFDILVHLVAVRSGACFQRIVDREAKNISQNTLALPGRRVVNSSARPCSTNTELMNVS